MLLKSYWISRDLIRNRSSWKETLSNNLWSEYSPLRFFSRFPIVDGTIQSWALNNLEMKKKIKFLSLKLLRSCEKFRQRSNIRNRIKNNSIYRTEENYLSIINDSLLKSLVCSILHINIDFGWSGLKSRFNLRYIVKIYRVAIKCKFKMSVPIFSHIFTLIGKQPIYSTLCEWNFISLCSTSGN